jgi:RNA repair, ligase-Pnkp-associating, region of Hen1/PNKP adenylyltransferase domain, C-terminal region
MLPVLLTVTTTRAPATDLGFLLHKHPDRAQAFSVASGTAHVFYPEADDGRCTAALLLEVDPVALVRGPGDSVDHYVNDRPYAASSLRSVGRKRSLALREYALGLEALDRVAQDEPLWRVHECVFGVLALESEPVDPRL